MRQSQLFTKTRKEAPKDEISRSAQLLIRAGYIHKDMAGVYSFLPLGLRVLHKIVQIIREEMNAIGGQEVELASLQDPAVWKASGRWDDQVVDAWFKTKLKNEAELGLALTHEEALASIVADHVSSYRDLPRYVYQFQTKFRNELRAKSGLLRTREFLMKDLYSFTATQEQLNEFYEATAKAYDNIFQRVGLGDVTHRTFASGGIFTEFSDEFQTLCESGEDTVYVSNDKDVWINKEVFTDDVVAKLGKKKDDFREHRSIEVGNIFKLGTKYAESVGLKYTDEAGNSKPVIMGSYGIGVPRVMATIVEVLADSQGIAWPASVAPFDVHVVELNPKSNDVISSAAKDLIEQLEKHGREVLHDDRLDISAGQKFADSDLIGIPIRIVVSEKTVAAKKFEVKDRKTGQVQHEAPTQVLKT